ncbi:trihelix transcription factor GTL1-like [Selaginella moellendorffii]|uniref:trihelix transcription factor GTL1-like n=1 Tax=Selaginella moellendorffii TaxID=88036 RepID=UPI000D1C2933|nr:trihelix transcription factor GTL1-like [Selaginella moellendorffii]|eukprot:XP_024529735.1 trihelix transcription factor GTL1-like [Selaginella moellendorffii]
MPRMEEAMEQDDEEEWRDEDEASSAVETGCCSSQSIPLFALSLLQSFPAPSHDSLFSIPAAAATAPGLGIDPEAPAGVCSSSAQGASIAVPRSLIPVEPCAKNEENDKSKGNAAHNSSSEQPGSKKSRSKNWTRLEMLKLIGLRADYEARFCGGGKKMELWDEIAEALNREGISRDGQQCRDKWEKLGASYKEVRDGNKPKEDFLLYDVLHPVLSGRMAGPRNSNAGRMDEDHRHQHQQFDHPQEQGFANHEQREDALNVDEDEVLDGSGGNVGASSQGGGGSGRARKKRKLPKYVPVADVAVVQSLVEAVVAKQQRFFRDLLDSMERREQMREQIRQEREEQWRSEDRAQRAAFNNAMIFLTQKLVGNNDSAGLFAAAGQFQQLNNGLSNSQPKPEGFAGGGAKKRSKNWKRAEVLQLIKLRGDMEAQFSSGTRRAAVWEELSEVLMAQGIPRDGKQCREKWDKLTAAYKDVSDGVKEPADMPYFTELSAALKKPAALEVPPMVAAVTEL